MPSTMRSMITGSPAPSRSRQSTRSGWPEGGVDPRLHQDVPLVHAPARDDLEALGAVVEVGAGVLAQALHEGLKDVAAKQAQILAALPRIGLAPIAPQDQTPEQGEVGALVQHGEQALAVDVLDAAFGQRPPHLIDQAAHHLLGGRRGRGARQAARHETRTPDSARPARISCRRRRDARPMAYITPPRRGDARRQAEIKMYRAAYPGAVKELLTTASGRRGTA